MHETPEVVYAPKVAPRILWQMDGEAFNQWRRDNDYPRIIAFFKKELPEFQAWMDDQDISEQLLIKHSPSTFLKGSVFYLYNILHNDSEEKEFTSTIKHAENKVIFHNNLIRRRKKITPYPIWYFKRTKKVAPSFHRSTGSGRSQVILSGLELLDVGNCQFSGMLLGDRKLDFVNMSDLHINNCYSTGRLDLSFSFAHNLKITGDLAFLEAYQASFSSPLRARSTNNLKLINGTFQSWRLTECDITVSADNAVLHLWEVIGEEFDAALNLSEIRDCTFKSEKIRYPIQLGRARVFHANIKRLYSQLGKKKEASRHYYLERSFERKSFLHPKANYHDTFYRRSTKISKVLVHIAFRFKYVGSALLNILWGYGERPFRVFLISIATIVIFALAYCYLPGASPETYHNPKDSLYHSMVTFATGDIVEKHEILRLLAGLEALLGLSFWGILIAGFTNNSKDY